VKFLRVFAPLSLGVILLVPQIHAERKNDVGTTVDLIGGAANQIGQQLQKNMSATASLYPSINLRSRGERSELDINYAFNLERYLTDPAITETSHAFTTSLSARPNKRLHFRFSDTFRSASDNSLANVLKDFQFTSTGFQYVFEPQLHNKSIISNSAAVELDIETGKRFYLTLGASSSLYYTGDASSSMLSDQFRTEGSVSYSYRQNKRQTWSVKYSVYQNDYQDYGSVRSHAATLVYARELLPTVRLNMEAGPSYTGKSQFQTPYYGYVASVNLSKLFHSNRLYFSYSHRSGDSTGLGTVTDSHQGGLGFSQTLGRTTSINLDASAFKQKQGGYWGLQGSIAVARSLGRHLVINLGGSYQIYDGINSENKRLFVSLGYRSKLSEN
jgi:hypothetical protein